MDRLFTQSFAIMWHLQILCLCFVRKAMDWFFTPRELFWLDHLLPEEIRKAKEDKEQQDDDDADQVKVSILRSDFKDKEQQDNDDDQVEVSILRSEFKDMERDDHADRAKVSVLRSELLWHVGSGLLTWYAD